jgi:hypothetical protein
VPDNTGNKQSPRAFCAMDAYLSFNNSPLSNRLIFPISRSKMEIAGYSNPRNSTRLTKNDEIRGLSVVWKCPALGSKPTLPKGLFTTSVAYFGFTRKMFRSRGTGDLLCLHAEDFGGRYWPSDRGGLISNQQWPNLILAH